MCSIVSPPISNLSIGAAQTLTGLPPSPMVAPAGTTPGLSGVMPARLAASSDRIERHEPVSKST